MRLLLSLLFFSAVLARRVTWQELDSYTFERYEQDFAKKYASPADRLQRQIIFNARLQRIVAHNQDTTKTWKEGVNHLTDRTDAELKYMNGLKPDHAAVQRRAQNMVIPEIDVSALPTHVDWRDQNVVSPVKDQGQCGSCWTFGTVETIEAHHAIKTGELAILSEQQILDCTPNPNQCGGTGGCGGGTSELAMARIIAIGGLSSEWTYPYQSYWGDNFNCSFNPTRTMPEARLLNYTKLPPNVYAPLLQAIATIGPIVISVDASAWSNYESGVFDGCNQASPVIDHAVQLVGYGTDSTHGPYWLVRNSWSPAWGEDGYIRLRRDVNQLRCGVDTNPSEGTGCANGPSQVKVCGTCGILYDNAYPIMK